MAHIHQLIDFTVSAFIVHNNKVLLIDHKKLKMWLPVGGHVELDEDTDQALFREIEEESGLKKSNLSVMSSKGPFLSNHRTKSLWIPNNIDIHKIDEKHKHIGLIYYINSNTDKLTLAVAEHNEIKWLTAKDLKNPKYKINEAILYYSQEALKLAQAR